jgi:hypothetical protein
MNLNVVHAHRRNIANADPVRALVERRKQSEVRPCVKQFRIDQIFAHNFEGSVRRQIADDRLPGLAKVAGAQNHRAIVARPIRIRCHIRDVWIGIRRFDPYNPLSAGGLRQVVRQFGPFGAVVFGYPKPTIVCSGPEQSRALRRFRE